jgi:PAS domain S-box-containing protein
LTDRIDLHHSRIFEGLSVLGAIFSGSPVGVALLDEDLRFVWVNRALAEMNGIDVGAHTGRGLQEVVPDLADALAPVYRRVLSSGEALVNWELSGETAARPGKERYRLENVYPLREDGAIVGLGAIVVEITGRTLDEPQLAQAEGGASKLLRQLQGALVPRARIDEQWGVAWRYRASEDAMLLGGDFLGMLERDNGSLALVIGDVAGRGADAAGIGALLRSAWLASVHGGTPVHEIPRVLDRLLESQLRGEGTFVTACFVEIDRSARELQVVSAGHDPPLLISQDSTCSVEIRTGRALGLKGPRVWPLQHVSLPARPALLLYTDGLSESRQRRPSARLGPDALIARIDSARVFSRPPQQALDDLLQTVLPEDVAGLDDDLAVILVAPTPR